MGGVRRFSEGGLPIGASLETLARACGVRWPQCCDQGKGPRTSRWPKGTSPSSRRRKCELSVTSPSTRQDDGCHQKRSTRTRPSRRPREPTAASPRQRSASIPSRVKGGQHGTLEGYERRIAQILPISPKSASPRPRAQNLCESKGLDVPRNRPRRSVDLFRQRLLGIYGRAAMAIKKGNDDPVDIARTLREGLQSFCIPGSVADDRKVGLVTKSRRDAPLRGHQVLLLLAGHESFAAAEGAIVS